jgi:hypothetical protein
VERLWLTRLRWRMRGAWLWPAFLALTFVDGVLVALLPPYTGAPSTVLAAALLAGFANLFLVAVAAPLAGAALRRRRRDLPRIIASDYAGVVLLAALTALIVVAGVAHRPAAADEADDRAAVLAAVHGYVTSQARSWRSGLDRADAVQLAPEVYRACVPGSDPRRSLCLIVDTDQRPAGVSLDGSMEPNRPAP